MIDYHDPFCVIYSTWTIHKQNIWCACICTITILYVYFCYNNYHSTTAMLIFRIWIIEHLYSHLHIHTKLVWGYTLEELVECVQVYN